VDQRDQRLIIGGPVMADRERPRGSLHRQRCKYDALMRTTVDLPPGIHRRATELARARGRSLSATIAELTARGLSQLDEPLAISIDERSGLPVVTIGRQITSDDVAAAIDDE